MKITVDARRCGDGKTTNPVNGIYQRIRNHVAMNDRVLVVVPNILLQEQYSTALADLDPLILNSVASDRSVSSRVIACMRFPSNDIVIITHAAFIRMPAIGYRSGWHLVIDEALEEVIRLEKIQATDVGAWSPQFDLSRVFTWHDTITQQMYDMAPTLNDELLQLRVVTNVQASMLDGSESWRRLTNKNYNTWMTAHNWTTLLNRSDTTIKAIQTLRSDFLVGWATIHIAAAAFEMTAMARWMQWCGIEYSVIHPFVAGVITGRLHTIPNMRWSKNRMLNEVDTLAQFQEYVASTVTTAVIALRNVGQTNSSYREVSVQPKHNAYGINNDEWMSSSAVSLESALVPDNVMTSFIREHWLSAMNKANQDRALTHLFVAYRFHQIVYRSAIRTAQNPPIDLFVIDELVALCLLYYWNTNKLEPIEITHMSVKPTSVGGRPPVNAVAMTSAERVRRLRAKNKKM
jgi:hypothetical protein